MLSVELKMATSAIDIDQIRSFMENVQEIDLGDERVTTFDQEHLFLHLCANVYRNFASYESVMRSNLKLRDFYDIYQFEQRGEIDWERCRDLARRYRWGIIGTLKHSKIKTKILLENVYERILFRSTTKIMCLSKSFGKDTKGNGREVWGQAGSL